MSAHQQSTSHTTWKELGSRTERRRKDRNYIKGRQRLTISQADYTSWEPEPAEESAPTYTPKPAPVTIHVTHVDVHVYTLHGLGTRIGHANSEWKLKQLLQHPDIQDCNGASLHGTIGKSIFSGCISANKIDDILRYYR